MRVTDVKTFVVDCFRTNWVFVKVYTDEGITGVGEGTLEYKEKALVGAIEHIKGYLVGKDPRQIEKHYHDIPSSLVRDMGLGTLPSTGATGADATEPASSTNTS